MIRQIVKQIIEPIIEAQLPWVTVFGGVSILAEKQVNKDGDTITYPVSVTSPSDCPPGAEPILAPDNREGAVLWIVETSDATSVIDPRIAKRGGMLTTQQIRLIGWVNGPKLGEGGYQFSYSPEQDVIRVLQNLKLTNAQLTAIGIGDDLPIGRLTIKVTGTAEKDHRAIFADYTFGGDVKKQKLFNHPYDFFAIDLEVQWLVLENCIPAFAPGAELPCPPQGTGGGFIIVSDCDGNIIQEGADGGACLTIGDIPPAPGDGVVTDVALAGTDLNFTGIDGGFNGTVDLSTLGGDGNGMFDAANEGGAWLVENVTSALDFKLSITGNITMSDAASATTGTSNINLGGANNLNNALAFSAIVGGGDNVLTGGLSSLIFGGSANQLSTANFSAIIGGQNIQPTLPKSDMTYVPSLSIWDSPDIDLHTHVLIRDNTSEGEVKLMPLISSDEGNDAQAGVDGGVYITTTPVGAGVTFNYKWTSGTSGDPGSGFYGVNNADPTLATEVRVSKTSNLGFDIAFFWNIVQSGDITGFEETQGGSLESVWYFVSGVVVDNGTYFSIPVTHAESSGVPDNNKEGVVSLITDPDNRLPLGGTAGQVLTKDSATDYDTSWQTPLVYVEEAPIDTNQYARQDGAWSLIAGGGSDGNGMFSAANENGAWLVESVTSDQPVTFSIGHFGNVFEFKSTVASGAEMLFAVSNSPKISLYNDSGSRVFLQNSKFAGRCILYSESQSLTFGVSQTQYSLEIATDRSILFGAYGVGTFTGTPAYDLQIQADGKIIETAVSVVMQDQSIINDEVEVTAFYADDASAAVGGVAINHIYAKTDGTLRVRIV